jgi:hypothetical protein
MSDELFESEELDDDVGLGTEDKKYASSGLDDWFKGEKNNTYRAALLYFHPLNSALVRAAKAKAKEKKEDVNKEKVLELIAKATAKRAEELGKAVDQLAPHEKLDLGQVRFKRIKAHYKENFGYAISRMGLDGPEEDKIWAMLGDVKSYFTTVLLIYPTSREGVVDGDSLKTRWVVKPWRFSTKVFGSLHQVAEGLRENDLSIAGQDLKIKCTNSEFQNFDIHPGGKALWRKNAKFQALVLEKAVSFYEKLVPFREMSTSDLRIKLGVSESVGEDVSEDDFDGLLNEV